MSVQKNVNALSPVNVSFIYLFVLAGWMRLVGCSIICVIECPDTLAKLKKTTASNTTTVNTLLGLDIFSFKTEP